MSNALTATRRSFVAGACLGAAGLAAAGLAADDAAQASAETAAPAEPAGAKNQASGTTWKGAFAYDDVIRGSYQVNMDNVVPIECVPEPEAYDYECDLLLIGYGVGGTSAALTAVNRGASVLAMERSPRATWSDHAGVGFVCAFGLPFWTEAAGLPDWGPESIKAFTHAVVVEHHLSEDDLAAAVNFFTELPKAFNQIVETEPGATDFEYVEVLPSWKSSPTMVPRNAHLADDIHTIWVNAYHAVENVLDRHIVEKGGKVLWGTSATNLVTDGESRVVGARGRDTEGNVVYVKAKAVLDCVGGMAANYDMIKFYGGQVDQMLGCHVGGLVNDGAGVRLCQGAGAGTRGCPRVDDCADGGIDAIGLGFSWNFINDVDNAPDRYVNAYAYAPIMIGRQPFLRVNKYGKRFMNEDNGWTLKMKIAHKQPDHRYYTVFDSGFEQAFEDIYHTGGRWGACEYPTTNDRMVYFGDDDIRPCVDWHEGFEEGLERGFIVKADTLDELAQKLGINAEGLKQTVEDYNALCAAGEDTQYGKDPSCLYPVVEPPFYGCERMPGIAWGVNGGVAIDMHGRVLTSVGEVIDGLYCGAGDGSMADGNTMEPMEQSVVPGGAHYALTMGYIAANAAIDDILAAGGQTGALVETPQDREPEELTAAEKLMNEQCAVCHSVPTPADFAGKDLEGATGLLTDNHDGMGFDEADARVIAEWAVRG